MIEENYFDKNGKKITEFCIVRQFEFMGRNEQGRGKKKYYSYKWIRLTEHNGVKHWAAIHLMDDTNQYYHLRTVANENRILNNIEIVQEKY